MIVIAQLAGSMNLPVEAFAGLREDGELQLPIGVVVINVPAPAGARGHVVEATSKFLTERAGH